MSLLLVCAGFLMIFSSSTSTPLDDYVNAPDSHYRYDVLDWQHRGPGFTMYLLNMTSQKWLTENESDRSIWWHYMVVAIPDRLTHPDTGLLYISHDDNVESYVPDISDDYNSFISLMAVSTGTICANVRQIPNQPIIFKDDPEHKESKEGLISAWTWKMFWDNPEKPEWLIRLPMTKASVRAMDTMVDFGKMVKPESRLEKFVVCGRSKRGWTAWTTAAVDDRVIAVAPIIFDMLNLQKNLHHHYRSLGGWTFALKDYYDFNFTQKLDDTNVKAMADIIDPYSYIDRLTMPKYIVTAAGDQFILLDDSHYYFADLQGDSYLRQIANADHSLRLHATSLFFGIHGFYQSVLQNTPRPKLRWDMKYTETGGELTVHTNMEPLTISVQHARTISAERRDFRLAKADAGSPDGFVLQPVAWFKDEVTKKGEGMYTAKYENPPEGWKAFFIEMTFAGADIDDTMEFCTETMIIPNTFPFPDCHGTECKGTLV